MKDPETPDHGLEALASELRRLPTPMPPRALVSRVRRLAHARLAEQAEERWERRLLAAAIVFSWLVSVFTFAAVQLLSGESVAYVAATWISGAAMLVVLGVYVRKQRRVA